MTDIGRLLVVLGVVIFIIGVLLVTLEHHNVPLGRLPGDFVYRGRNATFFFPLATSVLVSVVISIVLYLVARFRH